MCGLHKSDHTGKGLCGGRERQTHTERQRLSTKGLNYMLQRSQHYTSFAQHQQRIYSLYKTDLKGGGERRGGERETHTHTYTHTHTHTHTHNPKAIEFTDDANTDTAPALSHFKRDAVVSSHWQQLRSFLLSLALRGWLSLSTQIVQPFCFVRCAASHLVLIHFHSQL